MAFLKVKPVQIMTMAIAFIITLLNIGLAAVGFPTSFACVVEDAFHWAKCLNELQLLTFGALAVDQPPTIRLSFGDAIAVSLDWRSPSLLF